MSEPDNKINIEDLYRKYGPMVLRRCRSLIRDGDKALDLMQEVFVQLLRNRDRLRGDYPSSLLYKIATNLCFNHLRSQSRKRETWDDEILLNLGRVDPELLRLEQKELLQKIFESEDEDMRVIATMYFVDEMTLAEIGRVFKLSISGVRKRILLLQERAESFKSRDLPS